MPGVNAYMPGVKYNVVVEVSWGGLYDGRILLGKFRCLQINYKIAQN